jgi:putative transposase
MKRCFSDEQIIGFLREAEAGPLIKELCRWHGFSESSWWLWRSRFGGMELADAKRL